MARMNKVKVLCLVVAFAALVQLSLAAPAGDGGHEANEVVDEIIMRLKQLRQQSEGPSYIRQAPVYGTPRQDEVLRVHRTLDNLGGGYLLKRNMDSLGGGYLLKRSGNPSDTPRGTVMDSLGGGYLLVRLALAKKSQNDADHRALLYNYYNHNMGNKNMENPRGSFNEVDRFGDFDKRNFDEIDRLGSLYEFGKRTPGNFDEIDRMGFNSFKRKRNFDEIDRLGSLSDF